MAQKVAKTEVGVGAAMLHMSNRLANVLVWSLCVIAVMATLAGIWLTLQIAARLTTEPRLLAVSLVQMALPLVTAPMGALIATRRGHYAVGGVLLGLALVQIIPAVAQHYVILDYLDRVPPPGSSIVLALTQLFLVPMFVVLLLLLFPTGKFLSRFWLFVGIAAVAYNLFAMTAGLLESRWTITAMGVSLIVANPNGIWLNTMPFLLILPMFGLMIAAVGGAIVRYRRARGDERQQLKWFAYVGVLFIVSLALYDLNDELLLLVDLVALGLPIAIALAMFKYRLYDIDLIIQRTVTYGLVTAFLLGIFALSIIVLQQVFATLTGTRQNELVTVLSTLGIAALFVPLRNRVQTIIDRRFNRRKYDAQLVLLEFAETVRDETDLQTLSERLLEVVNETMQPKSVSLWMRKTREH